MRLALSSSVLLLVAAALAGCASVQPNRYEGLSSSSQLRPNVADKTGRTPFRAAGQPDWRNYDAVYVEPVAIYGGRDSQFDEDLKPGEKAELATYMRTVFEDHLRKRFRMTSDARPGSLRVRLTLTGAKTNTSFVSTITRFDLAGGPYNLVQGVRGREGAFIGSVMYSVEIFDGASGELLDAFVTKQYPNAMNVSATVGRLEAARVGLEKGAEELLSEFRS